MSYLRYLSFLVYSDVFLFVFVCICPVSCVPNVASFSDLSIILLPRRCSLTFI
jgi:hypothetical protein